MKIVFLGPAPPYRGGISLFALKLAKELQRQGHEPYFVNFKAQYPRILFPGKTQTDDSMSDAGFPNHRILVPWLPYTWIKSILKIKAIKPEYVVVSWFLPFFAPAYIIILAFLKRYQRVIIAHNVAPHEHWPLDRELTRLTFSQAERIVLLSHATFDELKCLGSNAMLIRAVLGFHPMEHLPSQPYSGQDRMGTKAVGELLFFGLIKPYKGLDTLLRAMPQVIKVYPDIKLRIAGEVYGDRQRYDLLIDRLAIRSNLILNLGYVSEPQLHSIFQSASLCILPYKTASQSGVIATSYSYGVPVLASDVGGLGEYVFPGETGYLVPPNDPTLLADAIINHLAKQPDLRYNIRKFIDEYSWEKLAHLVLNS